VKILIPVTLLLQLGTLHASLVGIMDSGTDISHKDLAPKTWFNINEKVGNVDLDLDGLPGDVNGWDFISGKAAPYDPTYNFLINEDVKRFFNLYSKYETKTISAAEFAWVKQASQNDILMNKVNFVGGYIHGTHVAGISTINVPNAKILALKVIPTVYQEFVPKSSKAAVKTKVASSGKTSIAPISIPEFQKELVDSTGPQVDQMVAIHGVIKFHKVDVVNQSFGIGYKDAQKFITRSFIEEIQRDPTEAELTSLTNVYMKQLVLAGARIYQAAPNTIFAVAAGNDTLDIDKFPDYPADIQADNKIVVAATLGYSSLAEFSNYGATKVDVAAPGVAITSTAPTNAYIPLSGTSQAAPFITNVVAQIKDINPNLSIRDVKALVLQTVDVKSWLAGKVRTSGVVNKDRATKAALYSKTMNITIAITKARAEVGDVLVNKSFENMSFEKLDINYRPVRPSLMIKMVK
jgi:subtilisin family serine protease